MDIDWSNVTFEFNAEENHFTSHDLYDQTSKTQSIQQTQQPNPIIQQVKRSRQEMEEEVFVFEVPIKSEDMNKSIVSIAYQIPNTTEEVNDEEFNPDDLIEEEVFEDDEDVKFPQQNSHLEYKNDAGDVIYYCESCSLDFPSIAYLKRHQGTKKHKRALGMEQRGKKVNQKRKYVRKNEIIRNSNFQVKKEVPKPVNFQVKKEVRKITDLFQVKQVDKPLYYQNQGKPQKTLTHQEIKEITDLTPEEIELLHMIDDQIFEIESENTAKNFYENFNFDLDMDDEPAPKIKQFSTVEEIMADLIASSEPYLNSQPSITEAPIMEPIVINLPIQVPQFGQPNVQVQKQQIVQIKHQPLNQVQQQPIALPSTSKQQVQVSINQEQQKTKIQCQMCPRTFNLRCHLTQHMNIVHSGNRNFKCPKCGKKYPEQELLDQHMEKHSGDKPFKCTKCVKSYNNKVDLKRHEKTHEEVKDFICKYCGGGFVRSDHLEKHLTIHLKHNRVELGDRIRSRKGLPLKNQVKNEE